MKYPRKWLEAVGHTELWDDLVPRDRVGTLSATKILDRLAEVGALKEPPKPREFWIVNGRKVFTDRAKAYITAGEIDDAAREMGTKVIHVREVVGDQ